MKADSITDERGRDVAVGTVVGLATLAMMFAGLLFAYAYLRASQPGTWPPPGEAPRPHLAPALASLTAVLGALVLGRGWGRPRLVVAVTAVATLVFQGLTLAEAWPAGLRPSSGPLGSVVFALTGLHGLHLAALGVLTASAFRAKDTAPLVWSSHVLAAFWLVIYVGVYVL